jgi:hypothetical protein
MVKINSTNANTGDLHRAISLSKKLQEAGKWDGQSLIVWKSAETVRQAIGQTQLWGELKVNDGDYKVGSCLCGMPDGSGLCT